MGEQPNPSRVFGPLQFVQDEDLWKDVTMRIVFQTIMYQSECCHSWHAENLYAEAYRNQHSFTPASNDYTLLVEDDFG